MEVNLKRLKAERIASGMTQDEVAEKWDGIHAPHTPNVRTGLFLLVQMSWQN